MESKEDEKNEKEPVDKNEKDSIDVVRLWQEEMVKAKIPCRSVDISLIGLDKKSELRSDIHRALKVVPMEWSDKAIQELLAHVEENRDFSVRPDNCPSYDEFPLVFLPLNRSQLTFLLCPPLMKYGPRPSCSYAMLIHEVMCKLDECGYTLMDVLDVNIENSSCNSVPSPTIWIPIDKCMHLFMVPIATCDWSHSLTWRINQIRLQDGSLLRFESGNGEHQSDGFIYVPALNKQNFYTETEMFLTTTIDDVLEHSTPKIFI